MDKLPLTVNPRPYQTEAVRWFIEDAMCKGIIADEMGLGKTGEAYMAWRELGYPTPALLVAGRNAQLAWMNQAKDWGCPQPVLIRGNAAERAGLWLKHKQGFVATTRESLKRDITRGVVQASNFKTVIVDECHKDANRKTGNYDLLKSITGRAKVILLTSGSIARRGPQSLWGPLNIVRPSQFRSYWKFLEKYTMLDKTGEYGWSIGEPVNQEGLRREVANILLRRTKAEVRPDMPAKIRDLNNNILEMSEGQARLYNTLAADSVAELASGDIVTTASILAKLQRFRQILVTPKLLDPQEEYGAGIDRIVEMLADSSDTHMAIFTPFASALPIIKERLIAEKYPADSIIELRGGLSVEQLSAAIDRFKKTKGIAICSIRFAESFDLIPATWGIFLGFEWDAWDNLQAEDRLHRGEIKNAVNIYYLRYRQGVDSELMLPALDEKTNNAMAILRDLDLVRCTLRQKVKPLL